ncbi:MAG TPA: cytochrome P450 [Solirubrobacterales bacterium]|nr:cytochrome P450 [Solirubrobacterales bacterium]
MNAASAQGDRLLLPPGPSDNVVAQTLGFHRDPLGYLRSCQETFGDVFTLRLLTVRPTVVVADPDAVLALQEADPATAQAGAARREVLPFAPAPSVFAGDGEGHDGPRRRIAPALAAETMAARRSAMSEIAARQATRWPRGRPFALLPRLREVTDEIFVRLVLGVRDEEIVTALTGSIQRMLRTPGNPPSTLPGEGDGLVGALGERLFRWRAGPLERDLARAVEARRGEPDGEQPDVLGCMVGAEPPLGTPAIVAELLSLLMAAQEPPAIALAWILDRLAREGEREVAEPLADETLRLQPPASASLRKLTAPFEAGGHRIPAGIGTMIPSLLLQRDPRAYEQPDEFRANRHRDAPPSPHFFPFGGGGRRCVGEPLARAEIATVPRTVLENVQLRSLGPEPEPMVQRATVLVPKRGLLAEIAA